MASLSQIAVVRLQALNSYIYKQKINYVIASWLEKKQMIDFRMHRSVIEY